MSFCSWFKSLFHKEEEATVQLPVETVVWPTEAPEQPIEVKVDEPVKKPAKKVTEKKQTDASKPKKPRKKKVETKEA